MYKLYIHPDSEGLQQSRFDKIKSVISDLLIYIAYTLNIHTFWGPHMESDRHVG